MNEIFKQRRKLQLPVHIVNDPNPIMPLDQVEDWGFDLLDIKMIHNMGYRGKGVTVAVLDTHVDGSHPDLAGAVIGYRDFAKDNYKSIDGHGTASAGIIGARDNTTGVLGVAPDCTIHGIKILDEKGGGKLMSLVKALDHCIDIKPDVINLSLGAQKLTSGVRRRIKTLVDNGTIIICAAGNTGRNNNVLYPAAYPETVAVAAINDAKKVSSFSSRGSQIDIAAPGENVLCLSTDGSYKTMSGTSFACPVVAGIAALMKGKDKPLSPAHFKKLIHSTAIDIESPGRDNRAGYGLINPKALFNVEKKEHEFQQIMDINADYIKEMEMHGYFTVEEFIQTLKS